MPCFCPMLSPISTHPWAGGGMGGPPSPCKTPQDSGPPLLGGMGVLNRKLGCRWCRQVSPSCSQGPSWDPTIPQAPREMGAGARGCWGAPQNPYPPGVPRSITRSFYRSAAGVLLVFDLTNRASFEHVPEWYREAAGDRPPAFVLVGHKCDLAAERAVSAEEAGQLAATLGMAFVETSARSNLNVELAFQTLAGGIQRALGRGALAPHRGCGGVRLIPSRSCRRPPVQGEPQERCQC